MNIPGSDFAVIASPSVSQPILNGANRLPFSLLPHTILQNQGHSNPGQSLSQAIFRAQTTPPEGRDGLVNEVEFLGLITGMW